MRTILRTAAAILTLAASAAAVPAVSAYYSPFSSYFADSPDFTIDQAFQYDGSDTFFLRVCNRGSTPENGGTLRVAVGRSSSDYEERYYSNVAPAASSCSNFEIPNVRRYGRKEDRTYGLTASVSWSGPSPESAVTNNSKNIPASATMASANSSVTNSWTSNSVTTARRSNSPVSDLYLDSKHNPYAGRTWYYSNGGAYRCGGYWNGSSWRPYSYYVSDYASDNRFADGYEAARSGYSRYSYSGDSHCYDQYVPGTSGYYWGSNGTDYSNGTNGSYRYYDGSSYGSYPTTYYSNGRAYSYDANGNVRYVSDSTFYDPTANQYYTANQYANPNFYIARIGRDGGARNVLATVCNNGADMSQFKDLSVTIRDLSKNTSFRSTQYVKLLSGQCRDVSINFSSFSVDFSGFHTFEALADSDNRFAERDENDNALKADIWVDK